MERSEGDCCYRRLAAAVIVDAVQDYTEARVTMDGSSPGSSRIVSEIDRKDAERFLKGRALNLWAAAAGVKPPVVWTLSWVYSSGLSGGR